MSELRLRASACIVTLLSAFLLAGCGGSDSAPMFSEQSQSPYVLPYAVGESYVIVQGNFGSFTHQRAYAYDFEMPVGTQIHAARGGRVTLVREDNEDFVAGRENVVFITHDDGSIGRYLHLTRDGAFVSMNDIVEQGQLIALSGSTGLSTLPHLHFDVAECAQFTCITLPVNFRNTRDNPFGLTEDQSYIAEPF